MFVDGFKNGGGDCDVRCDWILHHNGKLEDSQALKPNESKKKSCLRDLREQTWCLDNLGDFKYYCEALLLLAQKQMV